MLYNLFENRDFVSVFAVALLAEGVDRNTHTPSRRRVRPVALLAEGVDRNSTFRSFRAVLYVALLAEGVDRNYNAKAVEVSTPSHPPCRGYR